MTPEIVGPYRMGRRGGSLNLGASYTVRLSNPGDIEVVGGRFKLEGGILKPLTPEERMKVANVRLQEGLRLHRLAIGEEQIQYKSQNKGCLFVFYSTWLWIKGHLRLN